MVQRNTVTPLCVSAGGWCSTSACVRNKDPREVTLNFRYSSGYDTIELLTKGKGNPSVVSNHPFLVGFYSHITPPL